MPAGLTLRVKVIGQKSRSPGQKNVILEHFACIKSLMGQGQRSLGSRSQVKVKGHKVK